MQTALTSLWLSQQCGQTTSPGVWPRLSVVGVYDVWLTIYLPWLQIYLPSPQRCSLVSNNACPRCTSAGARLSCEVCTSPLMRVCVHHESRVYQGWGGWGAMEQARNPAAGRNGLCPGTRAAGWTGLFHSETELSCRPKTCTTCRWTQEEQQKSLRMKFRVSWKWSHWRVLAKPADNWKLRLGLFLKDGINTVKY